MLASRPACPKCDSDHTVNNGSIHNKKRKYKCLDCGRQFVDNSTKKVIDAQTRELIDLLLLERISLAGIARVTGVSQKWLQDYVNAKYAATDRNIKVSPKTKGKLDVECDELWSFVDYKGNKQWVWLAIDRKTREIVGVYIGDRSKKAAVELWNSLPPVYRQCAVCYTDFWDSYAGVFPSKRHKRVGKASGLTNHIERFNNTLRQRISRLVRKALSFSKKLENHIGAIWYFIHHYNSSLAI